MGNVFGNYAGIEASEFRAPLPSDFADKRVDFE